MNTLTGTDPLDPSANPIDPGPTKSIDINRDNRNRVDQARVSRSVDSYIQNDFFSSELGKSTEMESNASCDRLSDMEVQVGEQRKLMEQLIAGKCLTLIFKVSLSTENQTSLFQETDNKKCIIYMKIKLI